MAKAKSIDDLTAEDRLAKAKEKTSELGQSLIALIHLHESNKIVTYGRRLANQIEGQPHAVTGYNTVRHSLFSFEIVRLCSLWDGASLDRVSIPTIVELVRPEDVQILIAAEIRSEMLQQHETSRLVNPEGGSAADDGDRSGFRTNLGQIIEDRVEGAQTRVSQAIDTAQAVLNSSEHSSVKRHRDNHLAHQLEPTVRQDSRAVPLPRAKFGDEKVLLDMTITVFDALQTSLNRSHFHWDLYFDDAKKSAEGLWNRLRFEP